MIVVDASPVVEVLLLSEAGADLGPRLFRPDESLHAPELLDIEVVHVLRRFERSGALSSARAVQAVRDLGDLPLERYSHRLLIDRIWELRGNLTAYDASYVALAELLDCPLLTCDAALAAAPHRARVEVVSPV